MLLSGDRVGGGGVRGRRVANMVPCPAGPVVRGYAGGEGDEGRWLRGWYGCVVEGVAFASHSHNGIDEPFETNVFFRRVITLL